MYAGTLFNASKVASHSELPRPNQSIFGDLFVNSEYRVRSWVEALVKNNGELLNLLDQVKGMEAVRPQVYVISPFSSSVE